MVEARSPSGEDEAQIVLLCHRWFGEAPTAMTQMTFGHTSLTYGVEVASRQVVVRTHSDERLYAGALRTMKALGDLGLPLPEVIGADVTKSEFPFAYMLIERLAGRDLRYELAAMTTDQTSTLAEQLVRYQRLVTAQASGAGYGYVAPGERGEHDSWLGVLHNESIGRPKARGRKCCRCSMRSAEQWLRTPPSPRFPPHAFSTTSRSKT